MKALEAATASRYNNAATTAAKSQAAPSTTALPAPDSNPNGSTQSSPSSAAAYPQQASLPRAASGSGGSVATAEAAALGAALLSRGSLGPRGNIPSELLDTGGATTGELRCLVRMGTDSSQDIAQLLAAAALVGGPSRHSRGGSQSPSPSPRGPSPVPGGSQTNPQQPQQAQPQQGQSKAAPMSQQQPPQLGQGQLPQPRPTQSEASGPITLDGSLAAGVVTQALSSSPSNTDSSSGPRPFAGAGAQSSLDRPSPHDTLAAGGAPVAPAYARFRSGPMEFPGAAAGASGGAGGSSQPVAAAGAANSPSYSSPINLAAAGGIAAGSQPPVHLYGSGSGGGGGGMGPGAARGSAPQMNGAQPFHGAPQFYSNAGPTLSPQASALLRQLGNCSTTSSGVCARTRA